MRPTASASPAGVVGIGDEAEHREVVIGRAQLVRSGGDDQVRRHAPIHQVEPLVEPLAAAAGEHDDGVGVRRRRRRREHEEAQVQGDHRHDEHHHRDQGGHHEPAASAEEQHRSRLRGRLSEDRSRVRSCRMTPMSEPQFAPRFVPLLDAPGDPDEPSLLIAVQGTRVVLLEGEPQTGAPDAGAPDAGAPAASGGIFLGVLDGRHCWAVDVGPDGDGGARDDVVDLFRLWSSVDEPTWALAGRAVQLVEWQRNHRVLRSLRHADGRRPRRAGAEVPRVRAARLPAARACGDHAGGARRRPRPARPQRQLPGGDVLVPGRVRGAGGDARARGPARGDGGGRARRSATSSSAAASRGPSRTR